MNDISRVGRTAVNHPLRLLPVTFGALILLGTALLMLPVASAANRDTTFLQALFTSTSAVCVTGLAVVDTAVHWSPFGQGIILLLIQVGGLGIVTVVSVAILLVSDRLGLSHTRVLAADVGTDTYTDISRLVRNVVFTSLAFEVIFALLLAVRLIVSHDYDAPRALMHGAFHSVSAWNNAGFSLYSDNLMAFANDWLFSVVVCAAVILGGLGFPVLRSIAAHRTKWRLWSLHSKLTVSATVVLLLLGTVLFLAFEWSNTRTLGSLPVTSRPHSAFFMSTQTRTAGFNSVDTAALREESLVVSIFLMFIGGGSASTAGGIKVATFALLAFVIWAEIRGDRDVNVFNRRIPEDVQRQAVTVSLVGVGVVAVATLSLMSLGLSGLTTSAFEVVSALSTVGLSTGVAAREGAFGQVLLVLMMFIGRIGPVALAAALTLRTRPNLFRYPADSPLIG